MSGNSPRILLHIPPTDPPRRIHRLWQILRGGTLESPSGWSFDPSAEGAMTTARPPLSLIICPCLSLLSTDYCLSPCCHTLRRCSLTVRTLCLRREEWDHDPPAVTTRNLKRKKNVCTRYEDTTHTITFHSKLEPEDLHSSVGHRLWNRRRSILQKDRQKKNVFFLAILEKGAISILDSPKVRSF